ncbi:MAG: ATP-binding protein [Anaerolineaceae bacterium]|nr:ATP-binding protein [Anaerolineaceae bacterium]
MRENEVPLLEIKELLDSYPYLKQVLQNIKQVIWVLDLNTDQILYASPAFEIIWGLPCESLYADPLALIKSVHPEDRVKVLSASLDDNHRNSLDLSYRILRPDGNLRWISVHTFLIRQETSESSYQVFVAQDITDQDHVDQTLRKALDRSHEQFDLSRKMSLSRNPEAVLKTLMSAHELRSAQQAALLFFDNPKIGPAGGVELKATWLSSQDSLPWLSESSLYEDPALWGLFQSNRTVIITNVQSDTRLTPPLRDFLLEGQNQTLLIFPLVALAEWYGCLLTYYKQEYHFDHIELHHLKVLVNQASVTLNNLRLLEVEEESRHEAERANEIKTQFLAMISHELRTPLTSIIGFTNTLLADDVSWEPEEQYDFIQTIQQEANRLQELIDHLLDLSRLEAGRLPISLAPHSLHEIIEDALPQFHSLTDGHTLNVHVPANLPPVFVDAKRIAQVLVNLVRNASSYAPQGTEIGLSANIRGDFVQINIADQGPGISPAEHKKVFKAFQRGINGENSSAKGAGLGLAICKGLVEAHGGRIWIKKKTTIGTTISFTIPLVPLHTTLVTAEEE